MNNPKISIIVAMYNIQDYIIPCLESCFLQNDITDRDYEVIIVNDGATDSSPQLVENYIADKPVFRMITRSNGGLSAARNTGLDEARGEYVWFVDGDDAIAPNAISVLVRNFQETNCDAYIHNFSTFETKELISTSNFERYSTVLSGSEIHNNHLHILPMMAWLTVYKTSMLKEKQLKFREGIVHEDMEFSVRGHHSSESLLLIPESLYYYRIARKDSIMSGSRHDNTRSLMSTIEIIQSFKGFFGVEDNRFTRKVIGMCATSFMIRRYDVAFVMNDITRKLIKDYKWSIYGDMWRSRQWKRRALLIFIMIMPKPVIAKALFKLGERSKLM